MARRGAKEKKLRNVTEFQRTIRERRKELGRSQADIARAIGIDSPEFISMLELGVRRIDLNRVPALARALELDSSTLCQHALWEAAPEMFRTLFGENYAPGRVEPAPPEEPRTLKVSPDMADFWERYTSLPEQLRLAIDTIVKSLYAHRLEKGHLPSLSPAVPTE